MTGFIFAMMTKRLEIDSLLSTAALKKVEEEKKHEEFLLANGPSGNGNGNGKNSKKKGAKGDEAQIVVV